MRLRFAYLLSLFVLSFSVHADWPKADSGLFTVDTSSSVKDSDSDSIPDDWELANKLDVSSNDADLDPDGDGRSNLNEYNAGTNPHVDDWAGGGMGESGLFTVNTQSARKDIDNDGLPDSWEVEFGLKTDTDDSVADPDGDGLSNLTEYNYGTNPGVDDWAGPSTNDSALFTVRTTQLDVPQFADSDNDGMPDWWEVQYGLDRFKNDADQDLDKDGVSNLNEYVSGGIPNLDQTPGEHSEVSALFALDTIGLPKDSDRDGIPDEWELANGLDANKDDTLLDLDNDGLTNIEEYNSGTDPLVDDWAGPTSASSVLFAVDTGGFSGGYELDQDGDGIPDWWEVQYGLNPKLKDALLDSDGDGLRNYDEYNMGWNPLVDDWKGPFFAESNLFTLNTGGGWFDLDGDGLPDWWEKRYFTDNVSAFPGDDDDGDGMSNESEFIAGTIPNNSRSLLEILSIDVLKRGVKIRWSSVLGKNYVLERADMAGREFKVIKEGLKAVDTETEIGVNLGDDKSIYRIKVKQ